MTITKEVVKSAIEKANEILCECVPNYVKKNIVDYRFGNATSKWASVRKTYGGFSIYTSTLFEKIQDDSVAEDRLVGTMIHELIHTQDGCMDHKAGFKRLAACVNAKYPKYKIQRCNSVEDVGLSFSEIKAVKYLAMCTRCNHEWSYQRRPSWWDRIDRVGCPYCKTKTIEGIE